MDLAAHRKPYTLSHKRLKLQHVPKQIKIKLTKFELQKKIISFIRCFYDQWNISEILFWQSHLNLFVDCVKNSANKPVVVSLCWRCIIPNIWRIYESAVLDKLFYIYREVDIQDNWFRTASSDIFWLSKCLKCVFLLWN